MEHEPTMCTFDPLGHHPTDVLDERCEALRTEVVVAFDAFDSKTTRRALRQVLEDLVD